MIYVGKIVSTHGLKGEIKIISDFKYKDKIFIVNNKIYIDAKGYIIKSYRKHKNYDMVTLEGINDIDSALLLKNKKVFIDRNSIDMPIITNDLIGLDVYTKKYIGKVNRIINGYQDILEVVNENKRYLIPYVDYFISKIDIENKKIYVNEIEGLLNEN